MSISSVHAALTDNNEVYYSLDNTDLSSSNPLDLSSNGRDGTTTGATTGVSGVLNEAFSYDGSGDRIDVPNIGNLSDFTIAFWFKKDTASNYPSGTFPGLVSSFPASSSSYITIMFHNSFKDRLHFGMQDVTINRAYYLSDPILDTDWHHAVFTRDGNEMTIWVDGVNQSLTAQYTNDFSAVSFSGAETTFDIGNGNAVYTGDMDEVSIWSRKLSASEISEVYNSGVGNNFYQSTSSNFSINSNTPFLALVNSQSYNSSPTTSVTTHILTNASQLYNITISPDNFLLNKTFVNYNVSENLAYNFTLLNVSTINIQTNISLQNFSINIYQPEQGYNKTFSTTDGFIERYLVGGLTYITLLDSEGFALQSHTFTNITTDTSYTFELYESNSVLIKIYAQATGAMLTDILSTLQLSSTLQSQTNTTYNGSIFITDLTNGEYLVEVSVTGYVDQSQSVSVTNSTFGVLNFYMVEQSSASEIPFTGLSKQTCSHGSAGVLFLIFSILLPLGMIIYGFKLRQPLLGIIGSVGAMMMASYIAACFDLFGQLMLLVGIVFFLIHTFSIFKNKR